MPKWVIIGAQTKPDIQPELDWVQNLVDAAHASNTPVFMKSNLKVWPGPLLREFPKALSKVTR